MQFICVKNCTINWTKCSLAQHRFLHKVVSFFWQFCVSSCACNYGGWKQVNWGNCDIPWVNCAVLCVKDDWKGQFWCRSIACQNCAVHPVFPSGMTSHSKITQFNWACTGPLRKTQEISDDQSDNIRNTNTILTNSYQDIFKPKVQSVHNNAEHETQFFIFVDVTVHFLFTRYYGLFKQSIIF